MCGIARDLKQLPAPIVLEVEQGLLDLLRRTNGRLILRRPRLDVDQRYARVQSLVVLKQQTDPRCESLVGLELTRRGNDVVVTGGSTAGCSGGRHWRDVNHR